MTVVSVREVIGRVTHFCTDCGRPISKGEYKTEVVWYEEFYCYSTYTCCRKPWQIQSSKFPYIPVEYDTDDVPF